MLSCNTLVNFVALVAASVGASPVSCAMPDNFPLTLYGFGDWGKSLDDGSCCSGQHTNYDRQAQKVVATLMDLQAQKTGKPNALCAHGDNFYWNGIDNLETRNERFKVSYEDVYNGPNIVDVITLASSGNHDNGGGSLFCQKNLQQALCNSTEELLHALNDKFLWQSSYRSPNNDRWVMKDRYFVHRLEDPVTGVSIDIFTLDTNDADVAGMTTVCCQCYGYAGSDNSNCGSISRGDKYCAGGDTGMFDACIAEHQKWGEYSRQQIAKDAAASTATWKIVNTHFSFIQHFKEEGMNKWIKALQGAGVQMYLYGHTHGEKHDYSEKLRLHLVENGAGGGAKKEFASTIPPQASSFVKNLWAYSGKEYGFMSVKASKEWLKLEYVTAGDDWNYADTFGATKIGSAVTKHCWLIPRDGSVGHAC